MEFMRQMESAAEVRLHKINDSKSRKVKLYSERELAPEKYVALLQSVWGKLPEDERSPVSGRFDRFLNSSANRYLLTDLANCDVAVLPFDYGRVVNGKIDKSLADAFFDMAASEGKKTLVFLWSDAPLSLRDNRLIIFKTAFKAKDRAENEFVLPCWREDIVAKYWQSRLHTRPWSTQPTVSFCGRADLIVSARSKRVYQLLRQLRRRLSSSPFDGYPYRQLRARCLMALDNHAEIRTNFSVKRGFWGRNQDTNAPVSAEEMNQSRLEFINNIKQSDYVLCARGAGNFSIRFYEVLSSGRVPLYVDTGAPLPFENKIDWDQFLVRIPVLDADNIGDHLMAFHRKHDQSSFNKLQISIRRLWLEYLEPDAFFNQTADMLQQLTREDA